MPKIKIRDLESVAATKAKTIFGELLHQTSVEGRKFLIDRHGKPVSVILSYKEYQDLLRRAESLDQSRDS
jgi:prevent-host-death family protein